ncbi:MAG: DUF4062 domain-containing protein, partial [Anaerolineae bacterium]
STGKVTDYLASVQMALTTIRESSFAGAMTRTLADAQSQINATRNMIRDSDLFIGLYDGDYGAVPEGETQSYQELEYQFAVSSGKPIQLFMMEGALQEADERQHAFLTHIQHEYLLTPFTDAADLTNKVKQALDNFRQMKQYRRMRLTPAPERGLIPPASKESAKIDSEHEDTEREVFEEQVRQALEIAEDDLEQIVRRALEMHDVQHNIVDPSTDLDNKITVAPLWGEPMRRSQFQSDIFMVMPFRPAYDAIYQNVVRPTAAELNLTIKRGDEFSSTSGSIMQEVWAALNACRLVIAETTEINANVYYELGIAHTLGKPVILLTQLENIDELPFDIRHLRFIVYEDSIEGSVQLRQTLKRSMIWLLNDLDEQADMPSV